MNIVSNKPTITRKEIEGVLDCLINGELVSGNSVKNFENLMSSVLKLRHSLAVNSSTAAYHLAFRALELQSDDEVIIPSFFDTAPLSALTLTGAKPVLIDTEESAFTPNKEQIAEKITTKTKAIVIGHTFGFPFQISDLAELNIPVIEDVSHYVNLDPEEDEVTSAIRISSFTPGCLITTGNGAVMATNNSRIFSSAKELRESSPKNMNLGYDYCITDFQAAMGINQLSRLKDFIRRRKEIAKTYYDALKFTSHKTFYHYSDQFCFQSFPLIFDVSSEKTDAYWKKTKIEVTKPIPVPLHKFLKLKTMDYPNSDRLSNKLYSLPVYPSLSKKEIDRISKSVGKFA